MVVSSNALAAGLVRVPIEVVQQDGIRLLVVTLYNRGGAVRRLASVGWLSHSIEV